jgi:hypothetical protein
MSDTTRLLGLDCTWWVRLRGVLPGRPSDMQLTGPLSPTAACVGDCSGLNPRGFRTPCRRRPHPYSNAGDCQKLFQPYSSIRVP